MGKQCRVSFDYQKKLEMQLQKKHSPTAELNKFLHFLGNVRQSELGSSVTISEKIKEILNWVALKGKKVRKYEREIEIRIERQQYTVRTLVWSKSIKIDKNIRGYLDVSHPHWCDAELTTKQKGNYRSFTEVVYFILFKKKKIIHRSKLRRYWWVRKILTISLID